MFLARGAPDRSDVLDQEELKRKSKCPHFLQEQGVIFFEEIQVSAIFWTLMCTQKKLLGASVSELQV